MKKSNLSLTQKVLITALLADLFYRVQAKFLGHRFEGPVKYRMLSATADKNYTLDGIYLYTLFILYGIGISPDEKELEGLASVSQNYFEVQRLKATNELIIGLNAAKNKKEANEIIKKIFNKASNSIELLLNTETKTVQAYAELHGVSKLSAKDGISDPTIVKFGIVDDRICEACKKLWHDKDNPSVPKPWKMSELNFGYSSYKDIKATIGPTHPRCRHTISYVPPNHGFSESGKLMFKHEGYDYYQEYYKVNKKEDLQETLVKSCTCDDPFHHSPNLIF
jgi:hypothetical protein